MTEQRFDQDRQISEIVAEERSRLRNFIRRRVPDPARASKTLQNDIELMYVYTDAHRAALKLYLLFLEGDLKPTDEPLRLINAAIERGRSQRY